MSHLRPSRHQELPSLVAAPLAHTRSELVSHVGRREFETALGRGDIVRLGRDAYVGARHAESQWAAASAMVTAAGRGAAITGRAGLFLWGLILDAPSRVTVAAPADAHPRVKFPRVTLLRSRHSLPSVELRRVPVAVPEWAVVHSAREAPRVEALGVMLEALSQDASLAAGVLDVLRISPRARGRAVVRDALAAYDHGVRSVLEFRGLRDVLAGPEFAALTWQAPLVAHGRRFVIDAMHWPSSTAFEFDGARFHLAPDRWRADRERDTLLASIGVQTVRFPFGDVVDRPEWCRHRALEVIAQRSEVTRHRAA